MGESIYIASFSQQISYSIYLHRISIQHLAFPDLESLIRNRLFHPGYCFSVCNHCFSQNSLSMEQENFQPAGGRSTRTKQSVEAKCTTDLGVKRKRACILEKNGGLHFVSSQQERRAMIILESSYIVMMMGACAVL